MDLIKVVLIDQVVLGAAKKSDGKTRYFCDLQTIYGIKKGSLRPACFTLAVNLLTYLTAAPAPAPTATPSARRRDRGIPSFSLIADKKVEP